MLSSIPEHHVYAAAAHHQVNDTQAGTFPPLSLTPLTFGYFWQALQPLKSNEFR